MNTLMKQAKKPLPVVKEYDVNKTAERLVFEWGVELGEHDQVAKPYENLFAYNTFKLWQQQGVMELPVIVGVGPEISSKVTEEFGVEHIERVRAVMKAISKTDSNVSTLERVSKGT